MLWFFKGYALRFLLESFSAIEENNFNSNCFAAIFNDYYVGDYDGFDIERVEQNLLEKITQFITVDLLSETSENIFDGQKSIQFFLARTFKSCLI